MVLFLLYINDIYRVLLGRPAKFFKTLNAVSKAKHGFFHIS